MLHTFLHVSPGLLFLAAAVIVVFRLGSAEHRFVMTAVLVCWLASVVGQVLTGHLTGPIIAADAIFAIGLIWYAWKTPSWWVWALFAVEALRLLLHASQFQVQHWLPYSRLNNTLSVAGLLVLVIAAWRHARRRNDAEPEAEPEPAAAE